MSDGEYTTQKFRSWVYSEVCVCQFTTLIDMRLGRKLGRRTLHGIQAKSETPRKRAGRRADKLDDCGQLAAIVAFCATKAVRSCPLWASSFLPCPSWSWMGHGLWGDCCLSHESDWRMGEKHYKAFADIAHLLGNHPLQHTKHVYNS